MKGKADSQTATREARELWRLYEELGSWGAVGRELGLNKGLIHQAAHGTRSEKVTKALERRRPIYRARQFIREVVVPWLKEREA